MAELHAAAERMLARFGLTAVAEITRTLDAAGPIPSGWLAAAEELVRRSWNGGGKAPAVAAVAVMDHALHSVDRNAPERPRLVLHLQLAERTVENVFGDLRLSAEVDHQLAAETAQRPTYDQVAVAAAYPDMPAQQPFRPADPIEDHVLALANALPRDDPTRSALLGRLVHASLIRRETGTDAGDAAAVWRVAREALECLGDGRHVDAVGVGRVVALAGATWLRSSPGDRTATELSVRGGRLALAAADRFGLSDRHEVRSVHLALAVALMSSFTASPEHATVDEAIVHLEAYRDHGMPDDHGMYAMNLGGALGMRALLDWNADDLVRADRCWADLERELPAQHPMRPHLAQKREGARQAAQMVRCMPRWFGDGLVQLMREARWFLPSLPPVHIDKDLPPPGSRAGARTGRTVPPPRVPDYPDPPPRVEDGGALTPAEHATLADLAAIHIESLHALDPLLLRRAEERFRECLAAARPDSDLAVHVTTVLMSTLCALALADADSVSHSLEEAVGVGDGSLALLTPGSDRYVWLNSEVAVTRAKQGLMSGNHALVARSLPDMRAGIARTPAGSTERAYAELAFGQVLSTYAGLVQDPGLAAEASESVARASARLAQAPDLIGEGPLRERIVGQLTSWAEVGDAVARGDLDGARRAEADLHAEMADDPLPPGRFAAARTAMRAALKRGDWNAATDAAARAVETLPRLAAGAHGHGHRQRILKDALHGARYPWAHLDTPADADVAAGAVAATDSEAGRPDSLTGASISRTGCAVALEAERPGVAVGILEQGRAVLLSHQLDSRTDERDLAAAHPALARELAELRRLSDELEAAADSSLDGLRRRHAAGRNWEGLLDRIRGCGDRFAGFLRPPAETEMCAEAADGPIVLINIDRLRCDALLVTPTGIRTRRLPDLDETRIALRARAFLAAVNLRRRAAPDRPAPTVEEHDRARETIFTTLEWMWDAIAEPVLDSLGLDKPFAEDTPVRAIPRLWWSASGPLAYLPLHAAGYQRPGDLARRRTVLDHVASSYTPTVRVLRYARESAAPTAGGGAVIVTQPTGGSGRAGAARDDVAAVGRTMTGAEVIDGDRADPAHVLERLRDARWAHFACHGVSDSADPSASHLILAEGRRLSVLDVSRQKLSNADLAVLAVCHTARADRLPDEALHLAAGFLVAGYPQVVASLWQADDPTSARLTGAFYRSLRRFGGGVDTADAARHLNQVVRGLRRRYPRSPANWAPYVHLGR
ncbi:CHAT domain-containing protein [Streptomycetaceae bacterium NBC_01309]